MPDAYDRTDSYGAKLPDGPIQRLEPALEPLTKGLVGGVFVRKTAEDCMVARGLAPSERCPLCGSILLQACKL